MSLLFRLLTSVFFFLILSIVIAQDKFTIDKTKQALLKQYKEANRFFEAAEKTDDEKKQDSLDQKALNGFKALLPALIQTKNDSLAFFSYFKIGVIEHTAGNFSEANRNYNEAIRLKTKFSAKDSIFFTPLLYSGIIYYQQSQFDSALGRFNQAEAIADSYSGRLRETERLFNNLGVLYYETGNYKQAKNYFEKAIEVLQPSNIYYKPLLVNYNINLAQVLTKQGNYDAAYSIYQRLLEYKIDQDEIYHNLGTISLNLGAVKDALSFFRKVNYSGPNLIKLYNDIGFAFLNLKQYDSAKFYLQKSDEQNIKLNGNRKNVAHGLNAKYYGDILSAEGNYHYATKFYQQSIIQFDNDFNDSSIENNPKQFSGISPYINLFDALIAKASSLEQQFQKEKNSNWLITALNAYNAAFKLVDHVQKTYESDEARLFLNQIKYKVHTKPIDVAIELYEQTKDKKFLEEAYRYDQLNKASVLSLSLNETSLQQQAGVSNEYLKEMSNLKSVIAQLSLKAAKTTDSLLQKKVSDQVRDNEMELAKLQEKINANPKYAQLQPADLIPTVSSLQKKILDANTLLISYHLSEDELFCLYFTNEKFDYKKQKIDSTFFNLIDSFIKVLHNVNGDKFNGQALSVSLYDFLLAPILKQTPGIKRIIIIPENELNYLPFEALQDKTGKYLIESYPIQYQYSTALLHLEDPKKISTGNTLAFAPFTKNISDSFQQLRYSQQEVGSLKGNILLDKDATKKNFLYQANHYQIIHLATHASVSDHAPMESFIAFYHDKNDSSDFKLYAQEIYGLKLDSTRLVILSACETGSGQLVRGEGLMSLSRAFAYAGCSNIVTSLWKAEDKTTAFITERLHNYLNKNYTIDKALQQAKIDLLHSNDIDPTLKSPNYWAHLIFIGNYQKENSSNKWWWIAGFIIIVTTAAIIIKNKSRKKRD